MLTTTHIIFFLRFFSFIFSPFFKLPYLQYHWNFNARIPNHARQVLSKLQSLEPPVWGDTPPSVYFLSALSQHPPRPRNTQNSSHSGRLGPRGKRVLCRTWREQWRRQRDKARELCLLNSFLAGSVSLNSFSVSHPVKLSTKQWASQTRLLILWSFIFCGASLIAPAGAAWSQRKGQMAHRFLGLGLLSFPLYVYIFFFIRCKGCVGRSVWEKRIDYRGVRCFEYRVSDSKAEPALFML